MPKPIRPAVKWHGGKYYLCQRIIKLFPEHKTYLEPFGGAASVLLNKPPCDVEVYNDLDERITRFFRALREHGDEFIRLAKLTPYSEVEFRNAKAEADTEIEQARRDFVRWRMSIGGRGDSFSYSSHRSRRGMADVVSGYMSAVDEILPIVVNRFRSVQVVSQLAVHAIRRWDSPDTLIYCDPPYLPETREKNSRDVYGCEMDEADHRELADVLNQCSGKVILSGYPSPLYDELYSGWKTISFDIANHSAGGKSKARKQEVLWANWDIEARVEELEYAESVGSE